ncbi:hypothetical protein BS47DRAFT_14765 [Hydnum rufescens UP504]|uniref:Uncharacterized protein n=1 Tax=Hydnum rufescens UP504 TaxID=1448309 RepID=A0A9P6BBJ0_9AGAM|nr:hypothetical protein BS47DRAFT_14765 [Hydnum rufescens UP504]
MPTPELPVIVPASQATNSPKPTMVRGPECLPEIFPREALGLSVGEDSTVHPVFLPPHLAMPASGKDNGSPASTSRAVVGTSTGKPENLGRDDGPAVTHGSPTGGLVHSTRAFPVQSNRKSRSNHRGGRPFGSPQVGILSSRLSLVQSPFRRPKLTLSPESASRLYQGKERHQIPQTLTRMSPVTGGSPRLGQFSVPFERIVGSAMKERIQNLPARSQPVTSFPEARFLLVFYTSEGNVKQQRRSPRRTITSCGSEPGSFPDMHVPSLVQRDVSSWAPSHSGQGQESGLGLDTAVYKGTPPFETKVLGTPLITVPELQDGKEDTPVRRRGSSGDIPPPNLIPASDQHSGSPATSQSSLLQVTGLDAFGPIIPPGTILPPQNQIGVVPCHSTSGLMPMPTVPGPNMTLDQPGIHVSISTSPPCKVEDIRACCNEMGSQNTVMESILVPNLEPPTRPAPLASSGNVSMAKIRPDIVSSPARSANMVPSAVRRPRASPMMRSIGRMADQLRVDTRTPALSIGSDTDDLSGTEYEGFFVRGIRNCCCGVQGLRLNIHLILAPPKRSPLSPRSDSFSPLKTIAAKPLSIVDTNNALHLNMDGPSIDDNAGPFE